MTRAKCEFVVGNRAKNGKSLSCGRPAALYQMSGVLGSVSAVLCDGHAEKIANDGYELVIFELAPPTDSREPTSVTSPAEGS